MKKKSCYLWIKVFLLIVFCVLNIDCDFNIFKPNQALQIDSLYVVGFDNELYMGDTVIIKCIVADPDNDNIEYNWSSSGGELIFENNEAILISENDKLVNVYCKVSDGNRSTTVRCIEVSFVCYNYEKYFPISVGNKWTFNSIYKYNYSNLGWFDRTHYEGLETWEILANDGDTLTLEINFNGYSYFKVYTDDCDLNGGPYLDSTRIDARKVIRLKSEDGFWKYCSTIAADTSFRYLPGYELIKSSGIPCPIDSNEPECRYTVYDNYDDYVLSGHLFWDLKLQQGPTYAEKFEGCMYSSAVYSIELLLCSLNE